MLCLNVLHHLKNPVGVLRYLALHTADTLIIEAAQFGVHDVNSLSKIWQKDMKLSGFAKAFFAGFFLRFSRVLTPLLLLRTLRALFFELFSFQN